MSYIEDGIYYAETRKEAQAMRKAGFHEVRLIGGAEEGSDSRESGRKQNPTASSDSIIAQADEALSRIRGSLGDSEGESYTVTSDAELNRLKRKAIKQVKRERKAELSELRGPTPVHTYSNFGDKALELGRPRLAAEMYRKAIGWTNKLNEALFEAAPDESDARQHVMKMRQIVKKKLIVAKRHT
jgi:hypothetical protein